MEPSTSPMIIDHKPPVENHLPLPASQPLLTSAHSPPAIPARRVGDARVFRRMHSAGGAAAQIRAAFRIRGSIEDRRREKRIARRQDSRLFVSSPPSAAAPHGRSQSPSGSTPGTSKADHHNHVSIRSCFAGFKDFQLHQAPPSPAIPADPSAASAPVPFPPVTSSGLGLTSEAALFNYDMTGGLSPPPSSVAPSLGACHVAPASPIAFTRPDLQRDFPQMRALDGCHVSSDAAPHAAGLHVSSASPIAFTPPNLKQDHSQGGVLSRAIKDMRRAHVAPPHYEAHPAKAPPAIKMAPSAPHSPIIISSSSSDQQSSEGNRSHYSAYPPKFNGKRLSYAEVLRSPAKHSSQQKPPSDAFPISPLPSILPPLPPESPSSL